MTATPSRDFWSAHPCPRRICASCSKPLPFEDAADLRAVALLSVAVVSRQRKVPGGRCQVADHITHQARVCDRDEVIQLRQRRPPVKAIASEVGQYTAIGIQ